MSRTILPRAAGAALALCLAAAPAFALSVTRTATVAAKPDAVWKTIGEFCGIGDWHPAIASCTLSDTAGHPTRTLELKGGGTIVEEQVSRTDKAMKYTYKIVSSPLPVKDYRSTLSVMPKGDGSVLKWTGTFKANNAPNAKAEEVIAGIYEAGLKGIADKSQ